MKNRLDIQLKDALSSRQISYIFGAGISSALSGCRLGWYQWIVDGIGYLNCVVSDTLAK